MIATITQSPTSAKQGIFRNAAQDLLGHMKDRIEAKKPTFLSSLNPIFEETVQVSYMLSKLIQPQGQKEPFKTFYCNSHIEAVHGAIKIARSFQYDHKTEPGRSRVLFFDPAGYYETYFDPLRKGEDQALIPGVSFVLELADLEQNVIDNASGILLVSPDPKLSYHRLLKLRGYASLAGIITILDLSRWELAQIADHRKLMAAGFDIVVWGEALTGFQAPFGAFSTRKTIYQPWNSIKDCLLHSTTYGGNGMVLSFVKTMLLQAFPAFQLEKKQAAILRRIEKRPAAKLHFARKYMNPYTSVIYRSAKLDIDLKKADGLYITVRNSSGKQKRVIDCVGGSGCSLRGHNAADIVDEVIHSHRNDNDYFASLAGSLSKLTGLQKVFPAVSGASAVEIGMTLACLSNPSKSKILIFNGNYAGKTLLAINGTDADHSKYQPLYHNVSVCNPYAASARADLLSILAAGDVALIWFENIQGTGLLSIPPEIISLVNKHKENYGYLVGVDEILNGVYRTGNFLSFSHDKISADIVTLSKCLSDMVFPVSAALTSIDLYEKAMVQNRELVTLLAGLYKNQLGSHIAWHALQKAGELDIPGNVKTVAPFLTTEMNRLARQSKLFKSVEGVGFSLRVNMNMKKFPFRQFGYEQSSKIVTSVFYRQGNILTFFSRFLPPLTLSRKEAQTIIDGVQKTFNKSAIHFFMVGMIQIVTTKLMVLGNKLRKL